MKQIFYTLLTCLLFSFTAIAQPSNISVFSEQGEQFSVVLNGIKQNAAPETNIKITGVGEGAYKMKVIFADGTTPDIDKTVYVETGQQYTLSVKKNNKGEYVLRLFSMTEVAAPPPGQTETVVVYSTIPPPPVQSTTVTTTTTTTGVDPNATNVNVGAGVNGMGIDMNITINDGTTATSQQTSVTSTTTTTGGMVMTDPGPVVYVPGYAGPIGCPMPMAPGDFRSAKSTIDSKSFESSKYEIAQQIVGSNCLTSDQVKEVMQLFDFEATKLDFAKFAYSHTYDKGNYFKVNDAFDFESSISDLNDYIKGR